LYGAILRDPTYVDRVVAGTDISVLEGRGRRKRSSGLGVDLNSVTVGVGLVTRRGNGDLEYAYRDPGGSFPPAGQDQC
jgi:hypothetical protein